MARQPPRGSAPVDWAVIKQRIAAAAVDVERERSPERSRQVLEERARALARPTDTGSPDERVQLVTFAVATEVYGVEARYVVEVFRLTDLSPLPGAEPPISGVATWRGGLLVVLDLRSVLGLPITALHDLSRVIVLTAEDTDRDPMGLLADEVRGLTSVAPSEVRQLPEGVAANRAYLRGITGDVVLVLEPTKLLLLQH